MPIFLMFRPDSILQECSVQEGDIYPACWFVDERRHPTDTEESVCLFAVCVDNQQQ